jgi:hypothetical protein
VKRVRPRGVQTSAAKKSAPASAVVHEGLGLRGGASTPVVGEPETARAELFPEDAILFLKIVDDLQRLLVHPAGERHDEKLKHLGKRRHVGERSSDDQEQLLNIDL